MKTVAFLISNYINLQAKKHVVTREMEQHCLEALGQEGYWHQGGYNSFAAFIEDFVQQGAISPVKASGLNRREPPLYEKYRIAAKKDVPNSETRKKLLTWYHPQINTSHYLTRFRDYLEDESYLDSLDSFLKQHKDLTFLPVITANERSFQVFHDEKWLLSGHGHLFCHRTGLSLNELRCFQTFEPFFYYSAVLPADTEKINVLIVENKDTFFSLKTLFQNGTDTWKGCTFSLLIYGEGRKIQKSFSFFGELEEYKNYQPDFYYFGDLDPEGILIWYDLKKQYDLSVKPFLLFYNVLFEMYGENPPLIEGKKAGQKYSEEAIKAFLGFFDGCHGAGMLQMLEEHKYIPQEGLNFVVLKELAQKCKG